MSHLRLLLSAATKQYASLTLNKCSVPALVLKTNLHVSSCLKMDISGITDEQSEPNETKESDNKATSVKKAPRDAAFPDSPINPDFIPGGEYIPTRETYEHLVNGVRYDKLPRVYIKASYQNTTASAHTCKNLCLSSQSGGKVGFKHAKKKSSICGQTVGVAVGMDLIKKGQKDVRVIVKGQGSGRLSCMKGIQLAGVNIVSITDRTFPSITSRPRKPRRL
ncbi:small ribosomal subunit protein uS11m-like [Ruditapes philippinarum]|uniref:small ribosomal subunit protein uS11m-like n=1 Tax=Ruditapes philippinarum TaxID=129788 RepID=UPI00295BC019|nr:small ribosomal subunit protein uS11m-like [Ruditapes philippinarum]